LLLTDLLVVVLDILVVPMVGIIVVGHLMGILVVDTAVVGLLNILVVGLKVDTVVEGLLDSLVVDTVVEHVTFVHTMLELRHGQLPVLELASELEQAELRRLIVMLPFKLVKQPIIVASINPEPGHIGLTLLAFAFNSTSACSKFA
jgi:hypothetical protein